MIGDRRSCRPALTDAILPSFEKDRFTDSGQRTREDHHGGIIVYSTGIRGALSSFALAAGIVALASAPAIGATRQVPSSGTTNVQANAPGVDGFQFPEIPPGLESDAGIDSGGNAGTFNRSRPGRKLGVLPHKNLDTPVVGTSAVAGSNPEVALSFRALNHR